MEQAKVYFTDFRCHPGLNQQQKLEKLLTAAGMGNIDFEGKIVAIKLHFGELGNLAYLRPNYAKTVADFIKARGGRPFLTDCNTLYVGSRKNAIEHMDAAYINGFSPFSTGCHVIIADGLRGGDDVEVPVVGGEYVKNAKIGRALMDADIIISLTHFKGHEQAGFGGALKNLGMGGGSRAGKMEMHAQGKPCLLYTSALNARTVAVRSYHYVFCASSPASCHTCFTARYLSLGISSRIYVMAYQPPSSAQKERTRFAYDAPPFSCGHICQGASGRNEERGDTFLSGVSYLTRNVSSLVMSFVSSLRRSSSSTQRWGFPYSS